MSTSLDAWERTPDSSCRQCGCCCNQHCPEFRWQAVKLIKNGERFTSGSDRGYIIGVCLVFDQDITVLAPYPAEDGRKGHWLYCDLRQRQKFPFDPGQIPVGCSIRLQETKVGDTQRG